MQEPSSATRRQSQMKKVQQQFENWRENRTERSPIPEYLWESAVGLHGEYSVYEIAKGLRLEYKKLKSRILNDKKAVPTPAFIKLDIPVVQPGQNEWLIEMENADGTKMKISGNGAEKPDFALICQNFLGREQ